MSCGIRWKFLFLLVLMAVVLPSLLIFFGRDQVEMYAADRELVDAINDTQLAAGTINSQLIRVDRELMDLSARYSMVAPETFDAMRQQTRRRDYGAQPDHQAGPIYLDLIVADSDTVTERITSLADPANSDRVSHELLEEWNRETPSFGKSHWFGPFTTGEPNETCCWAIYPLIESTSQERRQEWLLARVNLTPAFEQIRHSRSFVSILDREGKLLFSPNPMFEDSAKAEFAFPYWDQFVSPRGQASTVDEVKAKRLLGKKYGWEEDMDESEQLQLSDIAGPTTNECYYRQIKIRMDDSDRLDRFEQFIKTRRDELRAADQKRQVLARIDWLISGDSHLGMLRLRGATESEVDQLQKDILAEWSHEVGSGPLKPEKDYGLKLDNFAICMVGIRFPSQNLDRNSSDPDMTLANAISVDEICMAATSRLRDTARGLLILAFCFCILGGCFAWYVTKPLMAMTEAAQELTHRVQREPNGNTDDPSDGSISLPVGRKDEVGALARAFSEMSDQVIASNSELNARVERRTQALAVSNSELGEKKAELEQKQVRLEQLVETLQHTSSELQEQRDRAELADKAKTGFLATVSHEMKTPLHHINGFAGRLRRGALDDRQSICVERIFEAIRQLKHLIGDVLDYQKILLGGMSVELESIDLTAFCKKVVASMSGHTEERGNQLTLVDECNLTDFVTDPRRLEQILCNLLTNASKFTQNGEIRLSVTRNDGDSPGEVVFEVKDSGVGIPPEHLSKLFTPFEKRKARQGNNDGTGLGLVICKELSRLMGGAISVESEVGVGTTFRVSLPRGLSADNELQVAVNVGDEAVFDSACVFQGASEDQPSVLIIDDDPRSTELLREELEAANCRVVTANCGLEGIEQAQRLQPDLIALDIVMPGMDGWAVMDDLKKNDSTKDIPIILVTIVSDSRRGLTLGADGYLSKPFEPDELRNVMKRVLGWHEGSVLIVDDDSASRDIARNAFHETNITITEAANGEEALEQIIDHPPDAILLDLVMPKMDGFELVEQLRSRDLLSKSKIVVVSGHELSNSERALLSDAVVSFFDKSALDGLELKGEIRRLLCKSLVNTSSS
ncbi:MAG: response regulator [Rubripirellula sp.]